jgi:phosphohistidine phosphatase
MAPGARGTQGARYLWLLRHAKTVTNPPPGGTDFDRVLAPRGRRDATALGRRFAGRGESLGPALKGIPRPGVVLVSPAARTAATADLVLADVAERPDCRLEDSLYGAEPDDVLELVRTLPDDAKAVMVVGHNPTAHALSEGLVSSRDKKGLTEAARKGFPTCAMGVYRFEPDGWTDVKMRGAKLIALMVPPYT